MEQVFKWQEIAGFISSILLTCHRHKETIALSHHSMLARGWGLNEPIHCRLIVTRFSYKRRVGRINNWRNELGNRERKEGGYKGMEKEEKKTRGVRLLNLWLEVPHHQWGMPFPARGGGQTSIAKADGEDITTNYTFKHKFTKTKHLNFY